MESINELFDQYKIPIVLFLVGSVLIVGGFLSSQRQQPAYPKESIISKDSQVKGSSTQSEIKVDIAGAVNSPGVHTLTKDARIEDLIKAAGGFSVEADVEYISKKLNLSQKVADGMKVYVPRSGESGIIVGATDGGISINSATAAELEALPGVGAVTANKIISKRPYNSVGELLTKKAVSKSVFEKIKDLVGTN